jgi:hypothetical protein
VGWIVPPHPHPKIYDHVLFPRAYECHLSPKKKILHM